MFHKPPHKDTEHPAGCYKYPEIPPAVEPLTAGSKRPVVDLSKRVTWDRPLKGDESPAEAYARGWADAIAQYESSETVESLWWEKRLKP